MWGQTGPEKRLLEVTSLQTPTHPSRPSPLCHPLGGSCPSTGLSPTWDISVVTLGLRGLAPWAERAENAGLSLASAWISPWGPAAPCHLRLQVGGSPVPGGVCLATVTLVGARWGQCRGHTGEGAVGSPREACVGCDEVRLHHWGWGCLVWTEQQLKPWGLGPRASEGKGSGRVGR